jgi:excisionase family DNA binding protein
MSKPESHPADLMTLREAGKRCGLSPITLRVLIRNGRLNAIKRGRDWFITEADLDTYLASRDKRGGYRRKTGS